MPQITLEVIQDVYSSAKKIYFENKKISNEIRNLNYKYNVKESSLSDYIYAFKHMMNGERYTRTINYTATKYYLENILKDFGYKYFKNALYSLELHINYYEGIQNITMKKQRRLLEEFNSIKDFEINEIIYPDEINNQDNNSLFEGSKKQIIVNSYERNPKARQECIKYYGKKCFVCGFDFEEKYGEIGKGFIHIHHIKPLSEINEEYEVNPIQDLRPVCPNCHAMIHKRNPPYSMEEIQSLLTKKTYNKALDDE